MFCGPYSDTPAAAEGAGGERLKAVVSHWYCGERGKSVLSDFVDLLLLVIGIPSVTQFHESFYNRAFAEGSLLSMSNSFTFSHRMEKKKQTKKEKESTVPAPVPALAYG